MGAVLVAIAAIWCLLSGVSCGKSAGPGASAAVEAPARGIVHGKGDTWTVSERPTPNNVTRVGGADGLVWALGREGLLFRDVL